MRICASAPKSTERGSLIVRFDALTGLFIAMRRVRHLLLGMAVAGMPAIALAVDSWSISIGVRETGTSAAIGDDGGSTGGIEWVNLDGQSIIADGLWHQYTWNFGTDPITNFSGGNGVLSSATMKGTLENIRILNSGGNTGGAINLRIDNIEKQFDGVLIDGQRAVHQAGSRKNHQPDPVALQHFDQSSDLMLRLFKPPRHHILRIHAE